jgi:ribosomal protein L11 methyltransferase
LRALLAAETFALMVSFEIKIEVVAARADAIDTTLLELGVAGWSLLEDAIAKRAWVVGIFASEAEAKARWGELESLLAGESVVSRPTIRPLGDLDWKDSYKAHFHAWRFGRLHWVPIWERSNFELPGGDAVLWLDPGLAFGTGNHETTRLCVERLVVLAQTEGVSCRVIDAGCGSGILALSAALLGYQDIIGFDNDAEAVRVSQENALLNGLDRRVEFFTADLVGGLSGRSAKIVMANIQADILQRFGRELIDAVAPGGSLILSGILAVERDAVSGAFAQAAPGWALDSRVLGEWSDVVLKRPI